MLLGRDVNLQVLDLILLSDDHLGSDFISLGSQIVYWSGISELRGGKSLETILGRACSLALPLLCDLQR